jgi:hypothetical protein
MTRRRKFFWLLVLSAIAALVAIILHDRFVAGPVYDGAPLNVWLRLLDYRASPSPDRARAAIRHLGPAAMPLVIEWLDWRDSLLRRALNAWVGGDPQHIDFQTLNPKDRRHLALDACDALGPAAQPAIPKLVAIATAKNPELDAPFLIARIGGPGALPALARISTSTNKYIRAAASVSADLFRAQSPTLLPNRAAASEQDDFERRLKEYHVLVLQAVTSGKRADNTDSGTR